MEGGKGVFPEGKRAGKKKESISIFYTSCSCHIASGVRRKKSKKKTGRKEGLLFFSNFHCSC